MEYVKGKSLRETIDENGCLSVKETIYYFKKILAAVNELHSFEDKIIHRDLKPENIIISTDKTDIKLIDFGISTVFGTVKKENTNENEIYGTYPYITPDVKKLAYCKTIEDKKKIINESFDIFSLGVILFEMLVGEKPFYAENYESTAVFDLPEKFDFVCLHDIDANIPNALENVIFKCLATKKEDLKFKYHSVKEIIYDIDRIDDGGMESFTQPLLKPKSSRMFQTPKIFDLEKEKSNSGMFSST
jgi:serine/threonine-protein kinase